MSAIVASAGSWDGGDWNHMLQQTFDELCRIARTHLRSHGWRWRKETFSLVNDAVIKSMKSEHFVARDPEEFIKLMRHAIKNELIDDIRRYIGPEGGKQTQQMPLLDLSTDDCKILATSQEIARALQEFPPRDQRAADACRLVYLFGCTLKTAAEVLSIHRDTCSSDVRYALTRLRQHFSCRNDSHKK
jgi:RNA polymerase sigma factor (sigma-70 family)